MAGVQKYDLAKLITDHPRIWTYPFVLSFAARTRAAAGAHTSIVVTPNGGTLRRGAKPDELKLLVPATLDAGEVGRCRNTFNDKVVTEYAAVAVAAAQVATALKLQLKQVTLTGERGDYWLATPSGRPAGLCEVSGTVKKSLEGVFKEKRKQVRKNKGAGKCYVSVTNFATNNGAFSRVR